MKNIENQPFGERLKALRKALKWTQKDLARESGVSQAAISRIESVPNTNVGTNTKKALLIALTGEDKNVDSIQKALGLTNLDKKILSDIAKLTPEQKLKLLDTLADNIAEY